MRERGRNYDNDEASTTKTEMCLEYQIRRQKKNREKETKKANSKVEKEERMSDEIFK
jgi:hypothetical protein